MHQVRISPLINYLIVLCLCASGSIFFGCQSDKSTRLMTFNIRYDNPDDGEFAWSKRRNDVAGIIKKYEVDILAIQEGLKGQLDFLADTLEGYYWMGVGRDDGQQAGEYAAIFYKHHKFDIRNYGNFWLSETPIVPGSIGWDAACVRIVTWAHFRDRENRQEFFVVNTHLDHIGAVARIESVRLIKKRISKLNDGLPVILAGDFNATDTSQVYRELTNQEPPFLGDSKKYSESGHQGPVWTFRGFNKDTPLRRIDYIFVSSDFQILQHRHVDDPSFGEYPSDHLPVLIEFRL